MDDPPLEHRLMWLAADGDWSEEDMEERVRRKMLTSRFKPRQIIPIFEQGKALKARAPKGLRLCQQESGLRKKIFMVFHGAQLNSRDISQPDALPRLFREYAKGDIGIPFLLTKQKKYRQDVWKIRKGSTKNSVDVQAVTNVSGYSERTDGVRVFTSLRYNNNWQLAGERALWFEFWW
jgi:hypothetical protein